VSGARARVLVSDCGPNNGVGPMKRVYVKPALVKQGILSQVIAKNSPDI
jgi:hypothetical protein